MEESLDRDWYLRDAIIHNRYVAVKRLIKEGADVNCETKFGFTPLHLAAQHNAKKWIFRVLLDNGADIDARNHMGETALDIAAIDEREKAVKILKELGAI